MKRGPGSLLGLFARSSRSEQSELRARKETATKVGAGILGAAALAALFLGVRHYQGRSLAQLLAILRDVTIDEETKRKALIGASPKDRASVLADLPAFATLVTQSAASTITQICDVLCLVPESAADLGRNQRRAILGCDRECCTPAEDEPEMGAGTTTDVPELVRRVRLNAAQSGTALANVLGKHRGYCVHALPRVLSICLDGKVATTVGTLKMLAAISKNFPDRTIDLMAITQITTGAPSVDELAAIADIDIAKFKFERETALAAFIRLELGGQSILAHTVLRAINPDWRTRSIRVPLPGGATLSERVRARLSAATWTGEDEPALKAAIASEGHKLPPIDKLRSECILGGNAIVVGTYTPVEYMIIFQDLWLDSRDLRAAAYKSATFGPGLKRAYPLGWFTMLGWMHGDAEADAHEAALVKADVYKVVLASVTLDEASTLAIEELVGDDQSDFADSVFGHVLALLPADGVPTERLLRVLGAGIQYLEKSAQTTKLASTIERWPVSFALQKSFRRVTRRLTKLGIGPMDEARASAIVDAAIKAERGGFSKIARALCEFAGNAAMKLKMGALLAQESPSPDIVHLALIYGVVDDAVVSAVGADTGIALRKLVTDTARRNAAGVPSTRAAALLEFVKARDIVSQFGMLYT